MEPGPFGRVEPFLGLLCPDLCRKEKAGLWWRVLRSAENLHGIRWISLGFAES